MADSLKELFDIGFSPEPICDARGGIRSHVEKLFEKQFIPFIRAESVDESGFLIKYSMLKINSENSAWWNWRQCFF